MIKLSYDVEKYRSQILEVTENGDSVIELGCHVGKTTRFILDNLDVNIIALDNSPESVEEMAKISQNNVEFIPGDVRRHEIISETFKIIQKCDVLAIDLGGGYHPDTVFKVFYIWSSTFKPKHTVIRNRGVLEFVNSCRCSDESYSSTQGFLESYNDSGIPPQIKEFELWTSSLKNI